MITGTKTLLLYSFLNIVTFLSVTFAFYIYQSRKIKRYKEEKEKER